MALEFVNTIEFLFPSLAALVNVSQYTFFTLRVSHIRHKTGLEAPQITGNVEFERAHRVQVNTLESLPFMIPLTYVTSFTVCPKMALGLGLLYSIGRCAYSYAYIRNKNRAIGYRISGFAFLTALALSVFGIGRMLYRKWKDSKH